jgi:hypothetical protein
VYGQITWERGGSFNGSQHNIWQAGTVISGAHRVRYDFNLQSWRQASTGAELREVRRDIVPAAPDCTLARTRQPTWPHVHTKGYGYYMTMCFKLRDCAVSNPSSPDGTFISPFYSTRTYHCVEASTGSC